MKTLVRAVGILAVALAHEGLVGVAQGAIQNLTVSGTVLMADAGNLFGLNVGSPISMQATYDDSTTFDTDKIPFDSSTTNLLSITLGSIQLNEVNDVEYGNPPPAYPRLILCYEPSLSVLGIDYVGTYGVNGALADYIYISRTDFVAIDANGTAIMGRWDLANCPEPATWILAATASLGLAVLRTRRRG